MKTDKLEQLRINPADKSRPKGVMGTIFGVVVVVAILALFYAWPRESDKTRVVTTETGTSKAGEPSKSTAAAPREKAAEAAGSSTSGRSSGKNSAGGTSEGTSASAGTPLLTVSGYIINRERIEISPRFMGVVRWVGVKKGDMVSSNQVVVTLDDSEYAARLKESEGRLQAARVGVEKARIAHERIQKLARNNIETQQAADDARLNVDAASATVQEIEGQVQLLKTYIEWTVIRSPINGVVLEKLVDPSELVTPQSFGGTRGPSTALLAVADPKDLQVEIDMNESDVSKVFLGQNCKVSPEAYPDKSYEGVVAEIAPEASRQKGTLQVKVQIRNPDRFLTPELSAKVDFLAQTK